MRNCIGNLCPEHCRAVGQLPEMSTAVRSSCCLADLVFLADDGSSSMICGWSCWAFFCVLPCVIETLFDDSMSSLPILASPILDSLAGIQSPFALLSAL